MCDLDFSDGEDPKFSRVENRKARKQHKCNTCNAPILPGSKYALLSYEINGSVDSQKSCEACWKDNQTFSAAHGMSWFAPDTVLYEMMGCEGEEWEKMAQTIRERGRLANPQEHAKEQA